MIPRPDLVDPTAPAGTEVFQLTTGNDLPASHVYMEAQIFTLDSRRFVFHESAHAHGSDQHDPRHRYLLCDLEDGGALTPLTDEVGATAPSISPDGEWLYYLVNETRVGGGRLHVRRVRLDGSGRETVITLDGPLPGTNNHLSCIYPLSTIRSDGQRLATSGFLGDGQTPDAPWGLVVFNLESGAVELILQGQSWCNLHPQYSRALDPERRRDILVQENHGNEVDLHGVIQTLVSGAGADIHVIGDDGSNFRDVPWGRDGNEFCQGHQCWRGRSDWAITSTGTQDVGEEQLIEARAVASAGHVGIASPGGQRNDLSRDFPKPSFFHFATDLAGERFVTDSGKRDEGGRIWKADLGKPGVAPLTNWRCLASPRSSWSKACHMHPFLSPDGRTAFFNSDESGILQAYLIRGYTD